MKRNLDLSVYMITDPDLCGVRGVVDTVRDAIAGGLSVVELRDSASRTGALVDQARAIAALAHAAGIKFVVSDRVDVALAVGADGVHLGHGDMAPADARKLIGHQRLLGLSVTEETELDTVDAKVVDYLVVGPTYQSLVKPDAALPIAVGGLAEIKAHTRLPVVAIGGLHAGNAGDVVSAGADGVAVVSAICSAVDPATAVREIREVVEAARR